MDQNSIFKRIEQEITSKHFRIVATDFQRPWGGFFVIDESQAGPFIKTYFPETEADELIPGGKISPKILVVAPGKRLSWQYHFRRAERWKVLEGPVAVAISPQDTPVEPNIYQEGELIVLQQGDRHRLIGLDGWGIVAEIWQHTNPDHPSDEEDIVRLQDDFARR